MAKRKFVRHFRIYFRNNHPAYIVDEEGNMYVFHRVTHSKTSGGKKNWEKENPLVKGGDKPMFIVKKQQKDKKSSFSLFQLETKVGAEINYPEIKKLDTTRHKAGLDCASSRDIKPKAKRKIKK